MEDLDEGSTHSPTRCRVPAVAETPLMVGSFHQVLTNLCGSAAAYCVATYAWTSAVIQTSNFDMACL